MDVDGIRDTAETVLDRLREPVIGAARGEDPHHIVGNLGAHLVPLVRHRHAMQLQAEIAQSVQCQDGQIGPGGTVKADALAGLFHFGGDGLFIRSGADETAAMDVEMLARAAAAAHAFQHLRHADFFQIAPGAKRMQADAVGDLAGDPQHRLAHGGDGDRNHRQTGRLGREGRGHQR